MVRVASQIPQKSPRGSRAIAQLIYPKVGYRSLKFTARPLAQEQWIASRFGHQRSLDSAAIAEKEDYLAEFSRNSLLTILDTSSTRR
jgi:hypothetical protein